MAFTRLETCRFIADHAAEIAKLAEAAKLPVITHLADMMKLQAETDAAAAMSAMPRRAA